MSWRIAGALAFNAITVALAQSSSTTSPRFDYTGIDSIVLERPYDQYLDHMPSYRITITRAGAVRYVAGPAAPRRETAASISGETFGTLIAHAQSAAFAELPDRLMGDRRFCRSLHTDAATVTVTLHVRGSLKRVVDYHGCASVPGGLREFERQIERAAGADPFKRR